jgi:hypothetical protein
VQEPRSPCSRKERGNGQARQALRQMAHPVGRLETICRKRGGSIAVREIGVA